MNDASTNPALELVELLESLERADYPWSFVVGGQARRLRRVQGSNVDTALHKLEGIADVIEAASLVDRDTRARLGELVTQAWSLQYRNAWPDLTATPDPTPAP
ncbi:hypothetical protein, partial [Halomonas lysinitropha]|uniref:hypothetical protein n=1 Tax=Halomonas lysinitropha TaxID=2607506 RepID=UPI00124A60DF